MDIVDKIARTLLIVDDSPEDITLYRRYLACDLDYDYTVLEARSEQQGWALWQQHLPDAVLLDYRMPRLTGLEFLAQLPPSPHQRCPVIIVTGQGNEAIAVQAMKAGVQDYLIKGQITPEGLQLAINSAIEIAQLRAQLSQRIEREQIVSQITQKIHQTLDLEEILQTTVSEVRQFLKTDRVLIFRLQANGWGTVQTESVGEGWTPLLSKSYQDPCHVELLDKLQVQANLVVPILRGETLWGLLVVHHCSHPRQWQPLEVSLLKELALHAGIALHQAELYQQAQAELFERKLAEKTLRESEEFKKRMLDSTPDCIKVLDLDGRLLYMNKNGMKAMEIEDFADFLNTEWFCFWEDEYRQMAEGAFAAAKAGETGMFSGYCPTAKGTPKWWEVIVSPIWDAAGQVERIMSLSRDVSDRIQADQRIQESEARLALAYQATQSGLWDWDIARDRAYISSEYCALFGLDHSTSEINYEQWLSHLHPNDRDYAKEVHRAVLANQQTYFEYDYRIMHPAGIRWISTKGQAFFNEKGHAVRMVGNVQDITERKQIEEALRENESLLRLALESAHAGTWDWNLATGNVIGSPETYELFGLDPTQGNLRYEDCIKAIHPDDRDRVHFEASQAAQQLSPEYRSEFRVIQAGQNIRWLLGQGSVSLDESGNPYKLSGINLDITERKQIEAQQQILLQREQAAREDAENANRVKDEFLAVVSHELRTPLNPILGWSQLLRRGQLNAQKTDYALDTIVRNAKIQAQLVDDLLDVSRILRGKLSLKKALIDPVVVIQTALETVRLSAEAKSIKMQTHLNWTEGKILGDDGRLQQIIWNLASNAIKFTPAGGCVDIRLQRLDDQAEITISDTGKGIPAEFLPYVFDRFWQQDAATTRQFGGLGLGLAIVKSLVDLHGGTVSADSAGEGAGTTFTVRLPLRLKSPVVSPAVQPVKQSLDLTGVQILVVDDNADTRDIVSCLLEQVGATVIALASAREALAMLKQSSLDVLISDIGMPDIDGYLFMRQVRALSVEQGGQVRAIALTAYAGEIDYQQAMASGFQKHLTKPVDPDTLVEAISQLIHSQ